MQGNTPTTPPPLLVNCRNAARMLAVSERTLWSCTAPRGDLPAIRIGRSVRYSVEALQTWIAERQRVEQ